MTDKPAFDKMVSVYSEDMPFEGKRRVTLPKPGHVVVVIRVACAYCPSMGEITGVGLVPIYEVLQRTGWVKGQNGQWSCPKCIEKN